MAKLDKLFLKEGDSDEEQATTKTFVDRRLEDRAQEMVDKIEEMLEDGRFEWAYSTLSGIQDSVRKWGKVSLGQRRAIENIWNSKSDEEIVWRY